MSNRLDVFRIFAVCLWQSARCHSLCKLIWTRCGFGWNTKRCCKKGPNISYFHSSNSASATAATALTHWYYRVSREKESWRIPGSQGSADWGGVMNAIGLKNNCGRWPTNRFGRKSTASWSTNTPRELNRRKINPPLLPKELNVMDDTHSIAFTRVSVPSDKPPTS
jgi:hypothetical protein